jgi:hypothetical protein
MPRNAADGYGLIRCHCAPHAGKRGIRFLSPNGRTVRLCERDNGTPKRAYETGRLIAEAFYHRRLVCMAFPTEVWLLTQLSITV